MTLTELPSDGVYPDGIDWVWVAVDRHDRVAAFVTAGVGPIPVSALNRQLSTEFYPESLIRDLPVVSETRLRVSMPKPDTFVAMAARGFFVYDWSDLHRTTRESIHAYELVASPEQPIGIRALTGPLAEMASAVEIADEFGTSQLDVRSHMPCREGVGCS